MCCTPVCIAEIIICRRVGLNEMKPNKIGECWVSLWRNPTYKTVIKQLKCYIFFNIGVLKVLRKIYSVKED